MSQAVIMPHLRYITVPVYSDAIKEMMADGLFKSKCKCACKTCIQLNEKAKENCSCAELTIPLADGTSVTASELAGYRRKIVTGEDVVVYAS